MSQVQIQDENAEALQILDALMADHGQRVLKGLATGFMMATFAAITSHSVFKTFIVFFGISVVCIFQSWSRWISPIALPLFLISLASWIEIDLVAIAQKVRAVAL